MRSSRRRRVRDRCCLGDIGPRRHPQLGADDLAGEELEVADLLGITVLEDLKIVFRQGGDSPTLLVGDVDDQIRNRQRNLIDKSQSADTTQALLLFLVSNAGHCWQRQCGN